MERDRAPPSGTAAKFTPIRLLEYKEIAVRYPEPELRCGKAAYEAAPNYDSNGEPIPWDEFVLIHDIQFHKHMKRVIAAIAAWNEE